MPDRALPERSPDPQAAPGPTAPGPARPALTRGGLIALQRTAGNAAVGALLQRAPTAAPPAADPIATLRALLRDGDESGAIAHMGRLEPDVAARALGMTDLRTLAVSAFDDEEMAHAMYALRGGSLVQKLNWMSAEGSSWSLIKPLLTDPRLPDTEKRAVYTHHYLYKLFESACDDDEMEQAVGLLGGPLLAQLRWMFHEGTSEAAVRRRISARPPAERVELYRHDDMRNWFSDLLGDAGMASMVDALGGSLDDKLRWMAYEDTSYEAVAAKIRSASDTDYKTVSAATRAAVQDDLSGKNWARVEAMLDRGVLWAETIDTSREESHWEKKDYTDPASPWYMETFGVESNYDIERTRAELRIRVRIKFTGITPTAAHKAIWRGGILAMWNGKFRAENADGKKLPIVFDPIFDAASPHHTIELLPPVTRDDGTVGVGRADAAHWYAGPAASATDTTNGNVAAHEFGHLIGLADEYQLKRADYIRLVGSAPPTAGDPEGGHTSTTIMGDSNSGTATAAVIHMRAFVDWLNRHRYRDEKPYQAKAVP
jgi:hypothetical protein